MKKNSQKYYPKIKFCLDLKQEKNHFLERGRSLRKFLPVGLGFVCRKNFIKKKNEILSAYLDEYYLEMNKYLRDSVNNTQAKWQKVEKLFFEKVDLLFHGWPWPKGNYRGYVSIGRSFPRHIKEKFFAFPMRTYNSEYANRDLRIIAHEMLHFIEYDYLQKKFGLQPSECNSPDSTFWQFTENLNVLLENTNFWREFSLDYKSKPYPDCQKLYVKMKKIWDKNKDIDNLVEKIFKLN
jgi:hypothetical protein